MALAKVTYTTTAVSMTEWYKKPRTLYIPSNSSTLHTQLNSIQDEIIANAAAIAAVSLTPGNGTVTNAILATDVKVGSLATLTTTEVGSVVGAINEIDASVGTLETNIGSVASLTTTAKTVVGAINELDADNALMVTTTGTQTLTNKHLTSPHITTMLIEDGDTGVTLTSADQTNASPTVTIPDIADAADTFVMCDTTQTLTAKTLTAPKIVTTGYIADAGGDPYVKFVEATTPKTYVQITTGDTTVAPKVQGAGETNTDLHLLGTGTGNVKVSDGTDPTKLAVFELNGATTGKTTTFAISHTDDRTITFPDASVTLASLTGTETLTNKTLTTPVIASIYQDAGKTQLMSLPNTASDTLAAIAATQTFTNKTLTTPVIASFYQDAGKTQLMTTPNTASDTLAAIAATQTLTNKTMDSTSNYFKNVVLAYAGNITRAEMITGKTLVTAVAGKTIRVLNYRMIVNGAFNGGAGTSMVLQDTNGTPVVITTALKAALTDGARISSYGLAIANVTDGAGLTGNLTASAGIEVAADAAWDAGTSVDLVIEYMYV